MSTRDTIDRVVRRLRTRAVRGVAGNPVSQIGLVSLSATAKFRLLDLVYAQSALLWTNSVLILLTGIVAWLRLGGVTPLAWLGVGLLVSGARIVDHYTYRRRRDGGASLSALRSRFTGLAWAVALLWGAASGIVLLAPGPSLDMLVVSVQVGYVATTIARNNPIPAAALGQACLILVPLALSCLTSLDPDRQLLAIFVLSYSASAVSTTRHLHEQTLRLLQADESNLALVRALDQTNTNLLQANSRLQSVASTDGLTGVANRRKFDAALAAEWSRAEREGISLGLLLIDIDLFKAYNDSEGHQRGDECLCRVAACLAAASRRQSDLLARYGGEEFVVLLPGADALGVVDAGEAIRSAVEQLALPHPTARSAIVTVSVGAASMPAASGASSATLVATADKRLYLAKRAGRNCIRGDAPADVAVALPQAVSG